MNTLSLRLTTLMATACLMPAFAQAADNSLSAGNCIRAFKNVLSTKLPASVRMREAQYVDHDTKTGKEFMIVGRNSRDNSTVARAVCTVDVDGAVLELRDPALMVAY
ncbi:MAG: hypothetical protein QM808_11630 [Steroidobacteraceae bacterium]